MDDHASQKPYPPEATGLERQMLQLAAAIGVLAIAGFVVAMSLSMYLLPNAPPTLLGAPLL